MGRYDFIPERYEQELTAIITELMDAPVIDAGSIARVLKRHPKDGSRTFSKSEIIRGFRRFESAHGWGARDPGFVDKLKTKPIRTESGVAPVTVLTKPFPCPGECVFCPNDVRMPKSYLSMEPGAQRAAQHAFDPYGQTHTRMRAFHNNGHHVDKVELIILGGTWSFYPEGYQLWFIQRCFEAMNDFPERKRARDPAMRDFSDLDDKVDGRTMRENYNAVVGNYLRVHQESPQISSWEELEAVHRANEGGASRCVGLAVETRPDHVTEAEVLRIRRLGATKVQIGFQSMDDRVLALNKRGHDTATTRRAMKLLRQAGFKIHAHWMPNLLGSDPAADIVDFQRLFDDPDYRPDELKIYPCSLIESAELMQHYESGAWRPYTEEELLGVLAECMRRVPRWCRLTRIIRDIPSHDILVGNKLTNLRQVATDFATARGIASCDIRSREIRGRAFEAGEIELRETEYATSIGREVFFEAVTPRDELLGFLRLSLPAERVFIEEIAESAMIREVHVYGTQAALGERDAKKAQHLGLGRRLIELADARARAAGFRNLAVISAIGTREYYRAQGFADGALYMQR